MASRPSTGRSGAASRAHRPTRSATPKSTSAPTPTTTPAARRYWLVKSEPDCFSWDDLMASPDRTTCWSGVRNFQARNLLRDEMHVGDGVLFYHSGAEPPGIVGIAEVVRNGYPDSTAWDPGDEHFDPKSTPDAPVWYMVDVRAVERFPHFLSLGDLRHVRALEGMELLRRGSRLSVQPVRETEWNVIRAMGHGEVLPATR